MKMRKLLLATVTLAAMTSAAQAGAVTCKGEVFNDTPGWTTIADRSPDSPDEFCRFKTKSPVGKRILAKCPVGSTCDIDLLNERNINVAQSHSWTIITIINVPVGGIIERVK